MENTTVNTSDTQVTVNTPDTKFVDYLIRTANDSNATPEETYRKLIEQVWERATQDNRKRVPVKELVTNSLDHNAALAARIQETCEVIRNTTRKLTIDCPPELSFGSVSNIRIIGITSLKTGWGQSDQDITEDIRTGKRELNKQHVVKFSYSTWSGTKEASLPVHLLNGDPIAVAQHVRKAAREYTAKVRAEKIRTLTAAKKDIVNKHKRELAEAEANLEAALTVKDVKLTKKQKAFRKKHPDVYATA